MKPRSSKTHIRGQLLPRVLRATAVMVTLVIVAAVGAGGSSADTTRPLNIASLGDSITAAWGANGAQQREQSESWSTGDDPAVNSHRTRLGALFGTTNFNWINNASSGSSVADPHCGLLAQVNGSSSCSDANAGGVDSTHQIDPLPNNLDYVTIEGGSADICGGNITLSGDPLPDTPAHALPGQGDFQTSIRDALTALQSHLAPGGVVLVASIPDWHQLWQDIPTTDPVRPPFACPLLFEPTATDTTRNAVETDVNAYNNVLKTECESPAFSSFCRYDGGAVHDDAPHFTLADLSTVDGFHLSPAGQAKLAAAAWNAGWFGGTDPAVSGTPQVGQVLTAVAGTWSSVPRVFSGTIRSWWRCPAGAAWAGGVCSMPLVQVAGDQPTYTPVAADIGSTIIVTETATTTTPDLRTAARSSAPTSAVVAAAPPPPPPPPPAPPSGGGGGGGGGGGVRCRGSAAGGDGRAGDAAGGRRHAHLAGHRERLQHRPRDRRSGSTSSFR